MVSLRTRRVLLILTTLLVVAVVALASLKHYWSNVYHYLDQPTYDPYAFQISTLAGASITNPTALQFGPDDRLYVATRFGLIHRFTIARRDGAFAVTDSEVIPAIQNIPNHTDQGQLVPDLSERLVTGLFVAGDANRPVVFVSSSDPRLDNAEIDTNSGVISRLDWTEVGWRRADLVRGIPRSRYDHAPNGLALDSANNILYLSVGSNTNQGAPASKFHLLPGYALSGAILAIDLNRLGNTTYDLPTLDDPDRPGSLDAGDPFGGNSGLNQAVLDPEGPVTLYTTGLRNAYDLVLTPLGLFTIDNGPNETFGGFPVDPDSPDSANQASEGGIWYPDTLHRIAEPGLYLGHPNLTRAFLKGIPAAPKVGLAPDPRQSRFLIPGEQDGALTTFSRSTNGLTMYWPEQGPWQNQLLTVGFDRAVYLLTLDPSGQVLTDKRVLAFYLGGVLLDVWAQRADSVFPHSIWVADHGQDAIYVLDPSSTAPADRIVQFFHSKIVYTRRALADAMARAQDSYRRWNQRRQVPEQE
jgi:glucose/arabinose dehydrogenase